MKKILILLLFSCHLSFSQNKESAEKLVEEGIELHDKGEYNGAIEKYNKALELDKDNAFALVEKSYTLLTLNKSEETIEVCKLAIKKHPKATILKTVYVNYGNSLDAINKSKEAIEIYDEGLKLFPDYYQLYFNKGVTYSILNKFDESIACFQKALTFNPNHASSHNGIGRLENIKERRIPSIMALCRFLVVEPQSKRAAENLGLLKELMTANVEKTGDNNININLNLNVVSESSKKGKVVENDFSSTDLISTMDIALDFDDKYKDKTEVEKFFRKMGTICSSLNETKKKNKGFYWEFYAPYFIELQKNNFIETFSYLVYASSEEEYVINWLDSHEIELNSFYEWSNNYKWNN